jgi:hypothetical protein
MGSAEWLAVRAFPRSAGAGRPVGIDWMTAEAGVVWAEFEPAAASSLGPDSSNLMSSRASSSESSYSDERAEDRGDSMWATGRGERLTWGGTGTAATGSLAIPRC